MNCPRCKGVGLVKHQTHEDLWDATICPLCMGEQRITIREWLAMKLRKKTRGTCPF